MPHVLRKLFCASGVAGATMLLCGAANDVVARTLLVPEDVFPLYAAIDSAAAGDTVSVAPGVYSQRSSRDLFVDGVPRTVSAVAFLKAGVHVVGREGAGSTVLDGGEDAPGFDNTVVYWNQTGGEASLAGFTLQNVDESGHAISSLDVGELRIEACVFQDNSNEATAALRVSGFVRCTVTDCLFVENEGLAIAIAEKGEELLVDSCEFRSNVGTCLVVGAETQALVVDCDFSLNQGTPLSVVGFGTDTDAQIHGCEFLENSEVGNGGGIQLSKCVATVEFCSFVRSEATRRGGAVMAEELVGASYVRNCTFFECYSGLEGSAIFSVFSDLRVTNNIVAGSDGGAAVAGFDGSPTSDCNLFWMNAGGDSDDWTHGPNDVFVDPLFCDSAKSDFTVHQGSPAVSSSCGQIGRFGVGCGVVSVETRSWSSLKAFFRD